MCFKKRKRKQQVQSAEPEAKRVKFEGQNDDVAWSCTSVTSILKGEQVDIVVPLSREGVCLVDGAPAGVWSAGRYNIQADPAYPSQDIKMYYINKTVAVPIKWGTANLIDLCDPVFEMPVRFGAHGTAKASVGDSTLFLTKIVGTKDIMTSAELADYFRNKISSLFTDQLANKMKELGLSYFELPTQLKTISDILFNDLRSAFSAYGIFLEEFTVDAVKIPEETLAAFSADKEMVRRYKLREKMFQTMYENQKADKAVDVDNQIRLIKAIGEAEQAQKDDRDITIVIKQGETE